MIGCQLAKIGIGWLSDADNDNAPQLSTVAGAESGGVHIL